MSAPTGSTVKLILLGQAIERARVAAGLSREDLGRLVESSESTIYRWESGRVRRPKLKELRLILTEIGITDPGERAELEAFAREGSESGWWTGHRSLRASYRHYIALEESASRISTYDALVVPGLLQTEAYATAYLEASLPPLTDGEIRERVDVRVRRQQRFRDRRVRLVAVLDEGAVLRAVGGLDVWRDQLAALLKAASDRHVEIQILPFSGGAHPGILGSFALLDVPGMSGLAYLEAMPGDIYADGEDAGRYAEIFDGLRAAAMSPQMSLKFLDRLRKQGKPNTYEPEL